VTRNGQLSTGIGDRMAGQEFHLRPSSALHIRPPRSIAYTLNVLSSDKTTQQGLIRCTLEDNRMFAIPFSSIHSALATVEETSIFLPDWIWTYFELLDNIKLSVIFLEGAACMANKVVIRPLIRVPSTATFVGCLNGLYVCKDMASSFLFAGIEVHFIVENVESEGKGTIFECNATTEIMIFPEEIPSSNSGGGILDKLFSEDIRKFLLVVDASRLHISSAESLTSHVHLIVHKDKRIVASFVAALKERFKNAWMDLDLYGFAVDDEIELDNESFDALLNHIVEHVSRKDIELLHIDKVSRLSSEESAKRLRNLLHRIHMLKPGIHILLTDILQPSRALKLISRTGHFRINEFSPSLLSHASRKEYLRYCTKGKIGDAAIDEFQWRLGGLDIFELDKIVEAGNKADASMTGELILRSALDSVGTSGHPEYIMMMSRGLCSWLDIKGYQEEITKIKGMLYGPWKERELYAKFGITKSPGILLHGPSGCGKSSIVQAIANDGIFNVLELDLAALKSKYLGETEERLRHAFDLSRLSSPCLLLIDGIDALGKRRALGGRNGEDVGGTGAEERLLSTLLNEMDGIEALGDVIVVGCSSRVEAIDSALKRPGRLDLHIEIGLPGCESRRALVKHWINLMSIEADDASIESLIERSEGLSCADIVQRFQEAGRKAIHNCESTPVIYIDDIYL